MIHQFFETLRIRSQEAPAQPAILAPGLRALTYRELWIRIVQVIESLRSAGVRRSDRVAIVLPNGPEMATSFLAVSACATSAPLNPAYSESEFEFYLSDLRARALIVPRGETSAATAVAERLGIAVLHLPEGPANSPEPDSGSLATSDEAALVLHTSGTTSRPKIVPLTHANIAASAGQIAQSLALSPADRCLNVMPLFHIHGLIGALLSSLTAGGSVVCSPGFRPGEFMGWLAEFQPTWYTAVPTMHQSVLKLAGGRGVDHSLRFIRSCSSALPPQLMADLEQAFRVPVVEAYGMTEASHQMATNPLPPRARKPGSVGLPAGVEVAILLDDGRFAAAGDAGEIAIRGPSVTDGYENNPAANASSFTNGWFRTGDRGYLDADGYVFIVGRIKEIINRGGEKISPREIDEALRADPRIAEALAFAMPHPTLGEDVAAAIVPASGAQLTERDVRDFAAQRLASFKVPRRIVFLKEIPKGPTGKPQRIGLAGKLGIAAAAASGTQPRTPLEHAIADAWRQVLGSEAGMEDDFFALGGDSIMAAQVAVRLRDILNQEIAVAAIFDHPTIAGLSEFLQAARQHPATTGVSQPDPARGS